MKILYIDTTEPLIHIALWKDEVFIEKKKESRFHSVYLIDTIKESLNELKLKLHNIDVFVVNIGPGSFTGTRVGILTAMGFSKIFNKKLVYLKKNEDYKTIPSIVDSKQNNDEVVAVYNGLSYFER
ncbi:MAG: tRNA (adenosine(37)-N6)-threonylcarbamoyltransferase complex dimerization subunit type 1 TsaB [Candidatus Muirbacterium halophilum]|nr:tRNA (adenosine(37)-N6)-threonylcarbamoyltransferase complex dimerization subunit type 1 TsaB [Candidatus Muirbacterium halophilum]MCK9477342.1 tRNA (adenosine(37)-N6)-threonylcarbamoyltransferase complex dimerization subunit type 1 TsaB [Candidatus Muirbacterium halophilum]